MSGHKSDGISSNCIPLARDGMKNSLIPSLTNVNTGVSASSTTARPAASLSKANSSFTISSAAPAAVFIPSISSTVDPRAWSVCLDNSCPSTSMPIQTVFKGVRIS